MNPVYRFASVRSKVSGSALSFTLHAGELRVLHLPEKDEKNAIIDYAVGEKACMEGTVEIVQGDRRGIKAVVARDTEERRVKDDPIPLLWQPLGNNRKRRAAWVAANGGMISNLRIWENIVLPLWYHLWREPEEAEQKVAQWLEVLGLEAHAHAKFMEAQPYSVELWQLKLAGLARALVLSPLVLVVDAALFDNIREPIKNRWIAALESYASGGGAVLVVSDREMSLPWKKIE